MVVGHDPRELEGAGTDQQRGEEGTVVRVTNNTLLAVIEPR